MILRAKVSVVYSFKRNTHDELHVSDNLSIDINNRQRKLYKNERLVFCLVLKATKWTVLH